MLTGENDHKCKFWGKFKDANRWLPLAAHCLDVGLVFRALCNLKGFRRTLTNTAGQCLTAQQLDRLAVLATLHDVGKANLGFQCKVFDTQAPQAGHIRELAPLLDFAILDDELHQKFIDSLPTNLGSWFADDISAYSYLLASFSHHGVPVKFRGETSGHYGLASKWWRPGDQCNPMSAVAEIVEWAQKAFPCAFNKGGATLPKSPQFHHRFAGLVMLSDWLGSHADWFPVRPVELTERLAHDMKVIPHLLQAVGLDVGPLRPRLATGLESFHQRFGFSPWPLQATIDTLDPANDNTRLVIAESETGSGKTEAALNWFFKLFTAGQVDSLYFALPTRVAARELYGRVKNTIAQWFPEPEARPVTVLAVPGYAQADGLPSKKILPRDKIGNRWQDDDSLRQRERQWAAEQPKRFLAATVAVGTIDQALLSAVQTAHVHLRSVCLDRSLLVVDEVHASDVYMSHLLESLLCHHLGCGGRAMLLSATLGAKACNRYVNAAGGGGAVHSLQAAQHEAYPAVTLGNGAKHCTQTYMEAKTVHFELVPAAFDPASIAPRLFRALDSGARVLIVMNTVSRANNLLQALQANSALNSSWLFKCQGKICPHHGRFAPEDRLVLDAAVSKRLGKSSMPGPLLLIGTQTLEQSLDIDADLLITDLVPADVLLQRVGRLQRHHRQRPRGYETPFCWVLVPEQGLEQALDKRGNVSKHYKELGYGSVYEDLRTLELTRRTLAVCKVVTIPRDNRLLVETATHPESLSSLDGNWSLHRQNIEGGELAKSIAAGHATVMFDHYFGSEDSEFHEAGGKVATRLGAGSLQLSLDKPFQSPFGQTLQQMVIPGHMAPMNPIEVMKVMDASDDVTTLLCGDKQYRYSRFGLEVKP